MIDNDGDDGDGDDDDHLYECMVSGSSEDGLKPLNPVDPVEGGVGQDLVHHLIND